MSIENVVKRVFVKPNNIFKTSLMTKSCKEKTYFDRRRT